MAIWSGGGVLGMLFLVSETGLCVWRTFQPQAFSASQSLGYPASYESCGRRRDYAVHSLEEVHWLIMDMSERSL